MTKKNKILLGIGVAGIAAYFILRKKKNFSNFTTEEYNGCLRDFESKLAQLNAQVRDCLVTDPTRTEKCCTSAGGMFVNGVCTVEGFTSAAPYCCGQLGGTLNGTECKDPNDVPPPPDTTGDTGTGDTGTGDTGTGGTGTGGTGTGGTGTGTTGGSGGIIVIPQGSSVIVPNSTIGGYMYGGSGAPAGSGSAGGGGGADEKKGMDEFDWIPYILAGITTALAITSEQKQTA